MHSRTSRLIVTKFIFLLEVPKRSEIQFSFWKLQESEVAVYLSVLAGRKELVLASFEGKVKDAHKHFSCYKSPYSRALADQSRRTKQL